MSENTTLKQRRYEVQGLIQSFLLQAPFTHEVLIKRNAGSDMIKELLEMQNNSKIINDEIMQLSLQQLDSLAGLFTNSMVQLNMIIPRTNMKKI